MRSAFFSSDVTVITAEKERPTLLRRPSQKQRWLELLWSIYRKLGLGREDGQPVESSELKVATRVMGYGVAERMHCECAVVSHLHHQHTSFPAFSYVGVSKFSCKPCHCWIKAFNQTMDTQLNTKDCHDKWYRGWARPGLGKADIQVKVDAGFLDLVERYLCRHQMNYSNMAREKVCSDSSDTSENLLPAASSDAAANEAKLLVKQKQFNPRR